MESADRTSAQVSGRVAPGSMAHCKSVGLAYPGSNPGPATLLEPAPDQHQRGLGPFWFLITICSQMPPKAAVGRWSRDIRGMEIGAFSQVVP
ncbi:MAG: hypothetical protein JWP48_775, partial [Actinoallomurus sp.]|nr:hypothetical protein [Actinoallomurus sp.]